MILLRKLGKTYPRARTALNFSSAFELLVAVILSAQCTDKRVNQITQKLFLHYRTIDDYAAASLTRFQKEIRTAGFFRNKARHIIASAKIIKERFGGRVPESMDDLLSLPGVARKSANIVLSTVYGKNYGIAVDTHVRRLSLRIGLTRNNVPEKIERDLMDITPQRYWGKINMLFVLHGRQICSARRPKCSICVVEKFCRYPDKGL